MSSAATAVVQHAAKWTMNDLPDEIVCVFISQLDAETLMFIIPQVCKRWRALCQDVRNVHLNFSGWQGAIPVQALAGSRQPPMMLDSISSDGSNSAKECGWKTGLCELFPHTTSVTMNGGRCPMRRCSTVEDAHLTALAEKCPEIAHANFGLCTNLTNEAVIALANKCRGIKHANFHLCLGLTDVAVIELAKKCSTMTHVNFSGNLLLTDKAVVVLAANCPEMTSVSFNSCRNLTDTSLLALAHKCPKLTDANLCWIANLTGAAKGKVRKQHPNCFYF